MSNHGDHDFRKQLRFAEKRIAEAGLSEKVEILFKDYRLVKGSFDKIVSIEMLEAVGDVYLEEYFGQCNRLLKQDGILGLQIITCPDSRYDESKDLNALGSSMVLVKNHKEAIYVQRAYPDC